MKKVIIYIMSLVIGLLMGFCIYSLIRSYLPVSNLEKINYDEYVEITENFNKLKYIKYGDLVVNDNNSFILINCFLSLNNINLSDKTITFDEEDFIDNIKRLFGNVNYELKSFDYDYSIYSGKCLYEQENKVYTCVTDNYLKDENTKFNYEVISANYDDEGNIIVKSKYYYSIDNCEGLENSVCLYKDENAKYLVVRSKKEEVLDYINHFDNMTLIYKRGIDNKLYLQEIKW